MRTITISELKATGVDTWSVKDDSARGYTTKYTSEIKPGDKVVIDNYFTLVTEEAASDDTTPKQEGKTMTIFANEYPYQHYIGYGLREAMRLYRAKYGLKGKHNIRFYRSYGGMRIERIK